MSWSISPFKDRIIDHMEKNSIKRPEYRKGAQSIQRAISLIRAVARHNERGISLSRVAPEAGLHVATAHRILSVLAQEGFITHDPISKLYYLGVDLFLLGNAAQQFTIRNLFRTALERIAAETGDTVFLLMRSGNDALCIDRVEGKFPIRTIMIDIGVRRPLGVGAGSLALITFLPADQFEAILSANASRYPQYKNLTAEDIRKLAAISHHHGYVVSEGLFHEGVTSIGVPLFDPQKEVIASITVSSISQRMDEKRRQEIVQLVRRVTRLEGMISLRKGPRRNKLVESSQRNK